MDSPQLFKNVISTLRGSDNWSDGFQIYQSLEEKQLLPEKASYNSVAALLAVHNLDDRYTLEMKHNAENMAPKQGDLPFLRYKNMVVGASDLMDFLKEKEYVVNFELTPEQSLLVLGVLSIIKTKLAPLELYSVWMDEINAEKTFEKYGHDQPKVLAKILFWQRQREIKSYLNVMGVLDKTKEQLIQETRKIFTFFSSKLKDSKYIIANTVTEADVYVYGHLQAILESDLESNFLLETLQEFPILQKFCLNFTQLHLGQQAMLF